MDRFVLTDALWAKMEPRCRGKPGDPGRSGKDNRLFIEAVLWIVRTGSPWRDLPSAFGNWSTAFRRFRDWREADVFKRIFDALSDEPDMEYAMVDATIVKVHRHGQGAKGGLRARPLVAPKAASPPKSWRSRTRSATLCALCSCQGSASTRWACRRSSTGSHSAR